MSSIRRLLGCGSLLACVSLAGALPALAANEVNVSAGVTAAGAPLALRGHDPVAYFTESAPTPGSARFAATHGGATYYFASQRNLDAFEADPERYAPAFGGFCTYGVSVGKKFDGDPRYWTIEAGRLYLNLNRQIFQKFNEDVAGNVARAGRQWRQIQHTAVEDL